MLAAYLIGLFCVEVVLWSAFLSDVKWIHDQFRWDDFLIASWLLVFYPIGLALLLVLAPIYLLAKSLSPTWSSFK